MIKKTTKHVRSIRREIVFVLVATTELLWQVCVHTCPTKRHFEHVQVHGLLPFYGQISHYTYSVLVCTLRVIYMTISSCYSSLTHSQLKLMYNLLLICPHFSFRDVSPWKDELLNSILLPLQKWSNDITCQLDPEDVCLISENGAGHPLSLTSCSSNLRGRT